MQKIFYALSNGRPRPCEARGWFGWLKAINIVAWRNTLGLAPSTSLDWLKAFEQMRAPT
jgi:hypothetical protein